MRIDPALEIAVAGEHRPGHQVALDDGVGDRLGQRPGIADAGGAAIADEIEAELIEILVEAGILQIVGDHLGARRQRGLHPGLHGEALLHRIARHQPCPQHDAGIGGVGTAGDRGDHHGAVLELVVRAAHRDQALVALAAEGLGQRLAEALRHLRQRHPVLRPLRPGEAGLDRGHVELQGIGEDRIRGFLVTPHALGLGVFLHQGDAVGLAAGRLQEADGLAVDREEAAGGAVFRRHVGDGGAIGQRQFVEAGAVEFDELVDHALLAQHLGDGQHQIGRGGAFLHLAGQLEADDFRDQHRDRLAEHGGLGLDATHAPAQHGEAVHHGGVAVGADQRIGIGDGLARDLLALQHRCRLLRRPDHLGEILQVDLMADAGAGRHDAEIVEGGLAPAQEGVALAVALVFELDVLLEGAGTGEEIHHHRVVDHQVDRRERVDLLRIAAELHHGAAHGGEIDHRRNAGEILHQHPGRAIGDLAVRALVLQPFGGRLDVVQGDRAPVLIAQQVLHQDLHRERQAGQVAQGLLGGLEAEIVVGPAPDLQRLPGFKAVQSRGHVAISPRFGVPGRDISARARCDSIFDLIGGHFREGFRRRPDLGADRPIRFHTARMPRVSIAWPVAASEGNPGNRQKSKRNLHLGLHRSGPVQAPSPYHNLATIRSYSSHRDLRTCIEQSSSPLFARGGRPTFAMPQNAPATIVSRQSRRSGLGTRPKRLRCATPERRAEAGPRRRASIPSPRSAASALLFPRRFGHRPRRLRAVTAGSAAGKMPGKS